MSSGHGADEREARTGFLGKCLWAGVRAACISPTYGGRIFQVVKQLGQEQVRVRACVCEGEDTEDSQLLEALRATVELQLPQARHH